MPSFGAALLERPLVLDGGLSTELERRGHDISGRLWSARLLRDAPEAVLAAHSAFLRAGAQVITTASYQATPEGFARAGIDHSEGVALLRRSVDLARRARDEASAPNEWTPGSGKQDRSSADGSFSIRSSAQRWVAGSVGPFGAMLADGSEYTGDYGDVDLQRLRTFHRPRLEILADAGVDVLAVETVPSLLETEALVTELAALDHPSWLSLTTTIDADGAVRTRRGELAEQAFALASGVDAIVAVGVNCTEPDRLATAIEVAAKASGKPVLAYPNSGEGWDAQARTWTGNAPTGFSAAQVQTWLDAGARGVGGCCRVWPEAIADLSRQLGST